MRAAIAAFALGVLIGLAGEARAQSPADLIDRDADIVIAGSPADIGAALRSLSELGHGLMIGLGRQALVSSIGFDLGAPQAWAVRGFDVGGDVWIALTVDDGEARYNALTRASSWTIQTARNTGPAFWHLRVIATASRARPVRALLGGFGRRVGLGAGNVRVRQRGDLVIVDVLRPMFSGAGAPHAAAAGAARAREPAPGRGFDRGAALGRSGLRGWLRAEALIKIGRAIQREVHIELLRDAGDSRGSGPWRPNPKCVELAALVDGHLFTELSWQFSPVGPAVDITFGGARAAIEAAFPKAGSASGLAAHRLPGLTVAGALRLAGLAGLRALPRTPVFRSFTDALAHIDGCEAHYGWTARLFGWPHLIGLFADEIAALGPRGERIAGAVSTLSAAATRWDVDPLKMTAVLEGDLAPAGLEPVAELLDLAFDRGRGDHWGAGRMRVYVRRSPQPVIGTSLGGDRGASLAKTTPGAEWVDPASLAALRADLTRAAATLRRWESRFALLGSAKRLAVDVRVTALGLRARIGLSR